MQSCSQITQKKLKIIDKFTNSRFFFRIKNVLAIYVFKQYDFLILAIVIIDNSALCKSNICKNYWSLSKTINFLRFAFSRAFFCKFPSSKVFFFRIFNLPSSSTFNVFILFIKQPKKKSYTWYHSFSLNIFFFFLITFVLLFPLCD